MYKIKFCLDNILQKKKTQFIIQGLKKKEGFNYEDTFVLIVK